jgi:hypothetical protein
MSKKSMPLRLPKVGGGRKLLGLLVLALVVWFVIRDPLGAAAFARSVGHGLSVAGDSISTFFRSL